MSQPTHVPGNFRPEPPDRGWFMTRRPFPAGISGWLAGLMCLVALAAGAQDSPVQTAPLRLRLELAPNSAWPADVGTVDVLPCGVDPGPFGVFTAGGRPVAFQTYWSASGEPNRIRFDTSGGARVYYLCHDAQLPAAPGGDLFPPYFCETSGRGAGS